MHLGLRLLFGFFLIAGLATVFVLRVFLGEVKPSVREVMEDILVDSANLLAEQALPDLRAMPAGGSLQGSRFARSVADYLARPVDAQIWGLHKRSLDLRVYVTDAAGRVVFDIGDTGTTVPPGTDYSRWRDVALTLRGEYGARTTRDVVADERSAVLYVAAPVRDGAQGPLLGVLTVAKPVASVQPFIDRAERKIFIAGAWLLGLSLAIGVAVTWWTVHSVRQLRRYALQARSGPHPPVPKLPGELGELAQAMGAMRERLDHHAELEREVRALTHELKSPLTAIGGAAELLHDDLPAADRERFAQQIGDQVQRLRTLVDRALELAKLERLQAPQQRQPVDLAALVQGQVDALAPLLAQRQLQVHALQADAATVPGDPEALALAVSNLLHNAVDFAPAGSVVDWTVAQDGAQVVLSLRDRGPGVPDFALPRLGERWFSTPRPRDGAKGSGLGLAIARQVAALHGGTLAFNNAQPGLQVRLALPRA